MSFFTKLQESIRRFMQGRNGVDILSRDLNLFALFLMVLDTLFNTYILYILGVILFAWTIYRMCSRNIQKRAIENAAYTAFRGKIFSWFKTKWQHLSNSKKYHYYKCPSCKQNLRVPKGKGKIDIACPKCGTHFIKKT